MCSNLCDALKPGLNSSPVFLMLACFEDHEVTLYYPTVDLPGKFVWIILPYNGLSKSYLCYSSCWRSDYDKHCDFSPVFLYVANLIFFTRPFLDISPYSLNLICGFVSTSFSNSRRLEFVGLADDIRVTGNFPFLLVL